MLGIEWLFWLSLAALLFTYGGYPLMLLALTPWRQRHTRLDPQRPFLPFLTLIIPARNEADHLWRKLHNCLELDYPPEKLEVLVVDDGSDDATPAIIQRFLKELESRPEPAPSFRVLTQSVNKGKTAALNRAVPEAAGEIVVFSDADSLISVHSLKRLVHPFQNPIVGCVGGRYFPGGVSGAGAAGTGFYWRYENYLRRKESQAGGILGASGALYAIRKCLYEPLDSRLINDDFIIPMRINARGYRSLYEPSATAIEDESRSVHLEFPRRVRIMAGNCEHCWLFRGLFFKRTTFRTALQLFCHKGLRIISPFWLLALFFSNGTLLLQGLTTYNSLRDFPFGARCYALLFAGQVAFYTVALAGRKIQGEGKGRKMLHLPWYFTMINGAALAGIYTFFFRREKLNWGREKGPANSVSLENRQT